MKLIDYVIQITKDIKKLINSNNFNNKFDMSVEEFIVKCYCPAYFKCLQNTSYEKPYKVIKYDDNDCKYIYPDNLGKCKECWNREI